MGSSVTVLGYLVSLLLCLSLSAGRYLEARTPYGTAKRQTSRRSGLDLFFKKNGDLPRKTVVLDKSAVLTCQAGGTPPPTIHWVKDGQHRIEQGDMLSNTNDEAFYEDVVDKEGRPLLRRSFTKALLYLDCITPDMEGDYSCVADTPTQRIVSTTTLGVDRLLDDREESCLVKRAFTEKMPARIYQWTSNRLEKRGATIQLFCRAEGFPTPRITWKTPDLQIISEEDLGYELLPNGDLLIRNVQWAQHMGVFTCIAENDSGKDKKITFVYPTK
ncbi:zwei Ig domain protein zig-3-like [Ylistrum balloti]|uniref:zwei Ig domain protein zig-3-like n=1 Tax=Ylistrum balloti TaxID=509963 RepID=UPI002905F46A|nr:zwei Ig domain protein zig-3-like [Ylistrum balloti]XP_060081432.1 zwei Ig domain protein zig-3-like [Ylistrum balloti]